MERNLNAYDFFAILVPGAVLLAAGYTVLLGLDLAGWPPYGINSPSIAVAWGIAAYVTGHLVERLPVPWTKKPGNRTNTTAESKSSPQTTEKPVREDRLSSTLLANGGKLGSSVALALEKEIGKTFGIHLTLVDTPGGLAGKPEDREAAFMFCWGYLQQRGDPSRPFMMQTLMRLCKSLRGIFGYTAIAAAGIAVVHATALSSKQLGVSMGLLPSFFGQPAWIMGSLLTVCVSVLSIAELKVKATRYDEFYVTSVYRGFLACRAAPTTAQDRDE